MLSANTASEIIACEQLVLTFSACFDDGDSAGMLELFSTNGVWKRQDGDLHGIEALRTFMEKRPTGILVRHVMSNLRTTFTNNDEAVVESYITVYRATDHRSDGPATFSGPDLVGRYRDVVIRRSGSWKLASREVRVDFKLAGS